MAVRPVKKIRRRDRRNPFEYWTRRYGYFAAFLEGGGSTTRARLLANCLKHRERAGITDTPAAVNKDIADHIYEWKRGNRGGYLLTVTEDAGVLTCTHVGDRTWADFLEGKVR